MPAISVEGMATLPIVQLEQLDSVPRAFSAELGAAFREFGFVGVRGHGIAEPVVAAAFAASRVFFAQPLTQKLECEVAGGAGQRGYTRLGQEKAKDRALPDRKEFFHVGRAGAHASLAPNVWPREPAGFRAAMERLFTELDRTGLRVLEGVALHLGLERDWFAPRVASGNSILRAIHYPPIKPLLGRTVSADEPPGVVRAAAHEDINVITLLVGSDEPGLEIQTRAGEWLAVTTLPGTIVVNVGDMLARLTNDALPSTTHRVVDPPPPWSALSRYSIPFFQHFAPDVVIRTLPQCCAPQNPAAGPDRWPDPITADEFLMQRLREIGLA